MAFATYDPTTAVGQVRLLVSDTVDSGHTWEDSEVSAALSLTSSNVFDAAAVLLDTARASFKKMISVRLFGEVSVSATEQSNALQDLANHYREIARCDAQMQMSQLAIKIDRYGRDHTDYDDGNETSSANFEDYSEDDFRS
ncbi:MAG: hypothetical protein M0R22_08595 [Dehalococcoidia bacterium]|jgi:hypothetical protein|nr:hypothetical protein [Dehalococcoidia bacterium]